MKPKNIDLVLLPKTMLPHRLLLRMTRIESQKKNFFSRILNCLDEKRQKNVFIVKFALSGKIHSISSC